MGGGQTKAFREFCGNQAYIHRLRASMVLGPDKCAIVVVADEERDEYTIYRVPHDDPSLAPLQESILPLLSCAADYIAASKKLALASKKLALAVASFYERGFSIFHGSGHAVVRMSPMSVYFLMVSDLDSDLLPVPVPRSTDQVQERVFRGFPVADVMVLHRSQTGNMCLVDEALPIGNVWVVQQGPLLGGQWYDRSFFYHAYSGEGALGDLEAALVDPDWAGGDDAVRAALAERAESALESLGVAESRLFVTDRSGSLVAEADMLVIMNSALYRWKGHYSEGLTFYGFANFGLGAMQRYLDGRSVAASETCVEK